MKNILMTALSAFAFATTTLAQTWSLLIPPSAYDVSQLNFSNTAFNQNSSIIYSVYKTGSNTKVQSFNLNSNNVNVITTSSLPPVDLYPFTYDYTNNRLIANRAGRENLYAVSAAGGAWSQIGSGTGDAESYGATFFWSSSDSSAGFFGGYGFFYTKNWVWKNRGSWSNPYVNNTICDTSNPAKRNCQIALGAPSSNKLYLFSGQGSCSGQQSATSCSLGSPWASDLGIYCWLKDLWRLDLTTHSFTNILPVNSSSISKEGQIVYDYTNNTFYILGGFIPSPTYNSNFGNITDYETGVLRFRVGIDNGFVPFTVGGTPPPIVKINNLGPNAAYYDAVNNQIVWARKDGIWAFSTCQQASIQPTNQTININNNAQFIVSSSNPGANYQWQTDLGVGFQNLNNVGQYSGVTTGTLTVSNVTMSNNNQNFRCIVSSGSCFDTSNVAVLVICAKNLAISPQTNSLTIGSTATFTAATSDPNPSYIWQSNFGQGFQTLNNVGQYSGTSTNAMSISNVQLSNHMEPIRAISTSGTCKDTSNIAYVKILDTCITKINDTVKITKYDTVKVTRYDTIKVTKYDTIKVTDTLVINATLSGVSAPNNTNRLIIYPNPAKDHITIDYGIFGRMSGYTLKIVNTLGQTVFSTPINQQSSFINLSTWTGKGMYYVQIYDASNTLTENRKIVLQ